MPFWMFHGPSIHEHHDATQLKKVQDAQDALLAHYELKDKIQIKTVVLDTNNDDLYGVQQARVYDINGDSSNALLLIHGGGGSPNDWVPMLPSLIPLAKQTKFRIIAVERPGHGVSAPFDYFGIPQDRVALHGATFLKQVLVALNVNKAHVVGNSFGGQMGMHLAEHFPECVASIALLGAPSVFEGQPIPFMFYVLGSWLGSYLMSKPPPSNVPTDLFKVYFGQDMEKLPKEFINFYTEYMSLRDNSLSWNHLLRIVLYKRFPLDNVRDMASKFDCFMAMGTSDPTITALQRAEIATYVPSENCLDVQGGGHLPFLEEPKLVAERLVQFVTNQDKRQ